VGLSSLGHKLPSNNEVTADPTKNYATQEVSNLVASKSLGMKAATTTMTAGWIATFGYPKPLWTSLLLHCTCFHIIFIMLWYRRFTTTRQEAPYARCKRAVQSSPFEVQCGVVSLDCTCYTCYYAVLRVWSYRTSTTGSKTVSR
jgi:hypothetical protein